MQFNIFLNIHSHAAIHIHKRFNTKNIEGNVSSLNVGNILILVLCFYFLANYLRSDKSKKIRADQM